MVNFNIIENSPEKYLKDFEEFKKDYVGRELTVKEIQKKFNWSDRDYKKALKHAVEDGVPTRNSHNKNPRYYYKIPAGFAVHKCINHKTVYYGYYATEDEAKRVVELLKQCQWDKKQLERIQKEVKAV